MFHSIKRLLQISSSFIRSGMLPLLLTSQRKNNHDAMLGRACAKFFIHSGALFIKLGQLLSTRQEMFSKGFLKALSTLQEDVPSFDAQHAKERIEQSFQKDIDSIFSHFQTQAIASASIAQVHYGTLHDGRKVVAKVLRPHVKSNIKSDIRLMKLLAAICNLIPGLRNLNATSIVSEFERILKHETNLLMEAGAMAQAARFHAHEPMIKIPSVIWPYASPDVLIMEYVSGTRLHKLDPSTISTPLIAQTIIRVFMKQIFKDALFHGDLHPGNVFINTDDPKKPLIVLIDFGIMGQLNLHDRYYLFANFKALLKQDYQSVAQLHLDSGWIPPESNPTEFASYARSVIEPICNRPIKDISVALLLSRLLDIGHHFNMKLLPELILLQKSLVHVESIVRQLDPNINVWQSLQSATNSSLSIYKDMLDSYLLSLPSAILKTNPIHPQQKTSKKSIFLSFIIVILVIFYITFVNPP